MKKCQICKKEIVDNRRIEFGRGEIHLDCYTPDKQVNYDVKHTRTEYSGERSPYWDWIEQHVPNNQEGEYEEPLEANADVTGYEENTEKRREHRRLITQGFASLSKRERQVFRGLMEGLTEEEIARELDVSQQMISKCRKKIRKKFEEQGSKEGF